MTEPGGTDPNASGWSEAGSQGSWGSPPAQPGQPSQSGWGAPPPPGDAYGNPPGYGTQPGWGAQPGYGGPGAGGPQGYGPPPYGYYAAPQTDGKAIGALVCAVGAWLVCPLVLAVVALILAGQSARDIRESGGRLSGDGMNTAARVISWVNIAGCVLFVLILLAAAGSASV